MAEENKNQKPPASSKADPDKVKKLEADLKAAFKEGRFDDAQKSVDELKKLDPENHVAERLFKKIETAKAESEKKENAERIKFLEKELKRTFSSGDLPQVSKVAEELEKMDPENKVAKKIEIQILKARKMVEAQSNKEKIKKLSAEIKELMKNERWGDVGKKANELLEVEWDHKVAIQALKKAGKAKNLDYKTLIKVKPPKEVEEPGFFAKLFKKKEEEKPEEKKEEKKPAVAAMPSKAEPKKEEAKKEDVKKEEAKKAEAPKKEEKKGLFAKMFKKKEEKPEEKHAPDADSGKEKGKEEKKPAVAAMPSKAEPKKEDAKKAEAPKKEEEKKGLFAKMFKKKEDVKKATAEKAVVKPAKLEKADKEKVKSLEADLKQALKENDQLHAKTLMDDIQKLDPENKAVKKAQAKADAEKVKIDAQVKKEKVKGLAGEIKELLKKEDWNNVVKKSNELLGVEWDNKAATQALKKVAKKDKVDYKTLITATPPEKVEKAGLFSKLLKKKAEPAPKEAEKKPVEKKTVTSVAAEISKAPVVIPAKTEKPIAAPVPTIAPKKETKPTPSVIAPMPAAKPPMAPVSPKSAAVIPPVKPAGPVTPPQKGVKAPGKAAEGAEKGNIFTTLFGKKEEGVEGKPATSIIDTIVAKTEQSKRIEKKKKAKKIGTGENFLAFTSAFLKLSIFFILISAGFFYAQNIDEENRVLSIAGIEENNAGRLKSSGEDLDEKVQEEKRLNKEITRYKEGYENEHKEVIKKIIENRMDWPDILQKLNEVTESVYEKNALAQYVVYNNYSYDVKTGQLSVNAELSDPLGKNLTKLAEIEQAFQNYPRDMNDPNDQTKPYFYGLKGFLSFAKSYNAATGRYKTNFSLKLYTKKPKK